MDSNFKSTNHNDCYESPSLNNFYAGRYTTMRQIGHHFKAETALDQINDSMENLVRETKAKLQISSTMKSQLQQSHNDFNNRMIRQTTADQEIDRELNVSTSRRDILLTKYFICPNCNKKILNCCRDEHNRVCNGLEQKHSNVNTEKNNDITENENKNHIAVRPHPLRNLRVIGVCFDAIKIAWDLPIFDGGEALIDFEISYCYENLDKGKTRPKRVSMSCLRWCNRKPLIDNCFILDGLSASTQYTGITMRCKNRIGWSNYSSAIDYITTGDPVNPPPPQRFEIIDISSNSISFSWSPPFHNGGGDIVEYDLSYEESVPIYNRTAGISEKKIIMQKKVVKIKKGQTSFDLVGLPGVTSFQNICLRATNSFGLISSKTTCEDIKTCKPSKEQTIREELSRVMASTEEEIDSDFFQPGILQRVEKSTYLKKLEDLLRVTLQHGKLNSKSEDDDTTRNMNYIPTTNVVDKSSEESNPFAFRQEQFNFRINSLRKEIDENRKTCEEHSKNRVLWVRNMQRLQDRIYLLQAELITLIDCKKEYSFSSILNDSNQKMKTEDLRKAVQIEINDKLALISSWKMKVILGDRESTRLNEMIKINENQLKDRLAAYNSFEVKLASVSRMRSRTLGCTSDSIHKLMMAWYQQTRQSKQQSLALSMISNTIHHRSLAQAIRKWEKSIGQKSSAPINLNLLKVCGRGGQMLAEVCEKRHKACDEVKSTIIDLKPKSCNTFLPGNRQMDLSLLPDEVAFEITRGDYYNCNHQYEDAIRVYLTVLREISNKISSEKSYYFFYCVVEEKVAFANINAKLWKNAILHLDSLICQAQFSQYNEFIPCAEILLGECHLNVGNLESAKESFTKGLKKVEGTNCQFLLMTSYNGLARCYKYMDDQPRYCHYKNLYDSLNLKAKDKINFAIDKANNLQNKLMNTSVRKGRVVHFQNASFRYVDAKNKLKKLNESAIKKTKESNECKKEIEDLQQLIHRLEKEIEMCISNGERMQSSNLIHDNTQKIETVELIERLELRKKLSKEALQKELERDVEISQHIKNNNDELLGLQEDLKLEQGTLIQKVLSKRLIRCMAFNALNKNGVNVYGRKNGGHPLIILTIDKDIYAYDIRDGKLINVFVGGQNDDNMDMDAVGHTSIITCVYFYGDTIYSGAGDKTVRCWNMDKGCLEFVATGHDATVTSICIHDSTLITGSADKCLILWNACQGQIINRVMGHSRGITSLHCGPSWCLSGDVDGEIFVWKVNNESNTLSRKLRLRVSEKSKITTLKCSKLEIICGDAAGAISIWWLENGEILQQRKVHDKSITDIQFDATVLICCSLDGTIKVVDVTTCQVFQTIRGHNSPVLSICFDRTMVLSLSSDGSVKQWLWQVQNDSNENGNVFHTFTEGDTLQSISKQYSVTMKDLLKWNVNRDIKKISIGQRLIVIKSNIKEKNIKNQEIHPLKRKDYSRENYADNHSLPGKDVTSLASRLNRSSS